ncbi:unnamed protein product [Owenia fusiformis]|uniref:Uncharacterized protein n=1 Tax=Owenia fusiformis TaxID=6347 RepID=A0A8J1Y984_OWEFU|nr:unnamed protein product [Owenia fusiformis]
MAISENIWLFFILTGSFVVFLGHAQQPGLVGDDETSELVDSKEDIDSKEKDISKEKDDSIERERSEEKDDSKRKDDSDYSKENDDSKQRDGSEEDYSKENDDSEEEDGKEKDDSEENDSKEQDDGKEKDDSKEKKECRIDVSEPEPPLRVTIIGRGRVKENIAIAYSCDEGFLLVGPKQKLCRKGKWRPRGKPKCKKIPLSKAFEVARGCNVKKGYMADPCDCQGFFRCLPDGIITYNMCPGGTVWWDDINICSLPYQKFCVKRNASHPDEDCRTPIN